jgi:hypothetical protein
MFRTRQTWLVAMLLLFIGCAPSRQIHPSSTPTWEPLATTMAPATPPPLGQVPKNCPVTRLRPQAVFSQLSPVIGTAPVWVAWPPVPGVFHGTPDLYEAPYGWAMTKVVWEVGPNYAKAVSVRGEDVVDHTPLLFQFGDGTLLLTPCWTRSILAILFRCLAQHGGNGVPTLCRPRLAATPCEWRGPQDTGLSLLRLGHRLSPCC